MMPVPEAVPVGTIVPYAAPINNPTDPQGASYPDYQSQAYNLRLERQGWLVCDGRRVAVARYPELFRVLGYIHGQDGPGWFLLPDYRGRVLRGVNLGAQGPDQLPRDPQADRRGAAGSGGWQGNQVGSVQDDALQAHQHTYRQAVSSATGGQGPAVYSLSTTTPTENTVVPPDYTPAITIREAPETRVKNAYVNYLIRYTSGRPRGLGGLIGFDI
ncbi:microcystin-dependent protein [Duganella sp. 1224]|uniref:tail fiber protein n=1 Tax=Duganella sp. 1224 TaxID=2587052 RepID=UPI0015C9E0C5|nr:tail fiber protein [Duganella sp. 1224]NYE59929.1 microcystin-dependent protein [Duganella sp. 1224]